MCTVCAIQNKILLLDPSFEKYETPFSVREGNNLAVIYDVSRTGTAEECPMGLRCMVEELGPGLLRGWEMTLQDEMPLFTKVLTNCPLYIHNTYDRDHRISS